MKIYETILCILINKLLDLGARKIVSIIHIHIKDEEDGRTRKTALFLFVPRTLGSQWELIPACTPGNPDPMGGQNSQGLTYKLVSA